MATTAGKMKALVYNGVGKVALEERPLPTIQKPGDAVVKMVYSTMYVARLFIKVRRTCMACMATSWVLVITAQVTTTPSKRHQLTPGFHSCGSDLHIIKGDVPTVSPGRVLGHEGVGIVTSTGASVSNFAAGDLVLVGCITVCSTCAHCRRGMHSNCTGGGGWVLGHTVDGTQAQFVRIPHADNSLYRVPEAVGKKADDLKALVMVSDALPTGLECGAQNARLAPGSSVVIVGAGPVGLAALITAQLYSPGFVVVVDLDQERLDVARGMGAQYTAKPDQAKELVMRLTEGRGADAVMEVVGVPQTFELCQELVAPGGVLANVGVHGEKVDLHLETLWSRNICEWCRLFPFFLVVLTQAPARDFRGLLGPRLTSFPLKQSQRGWSTPSRRPCC